MTRTAAPHPRSADAPRDSSERSVRPDAPDTGQSRRTADRGVRANQPVNRASQGMRGAFWLAAMQCGFKGAVDCIKAFSETDFTEDLKKFDVPMLILHGDDDQIVPIGTSALRSSKLVKDARLKVYPSAPHGLMDTHRDEINADLLAFLRS